MPRFRFSNAPDSQIDPFNAGDPKMPGDEPEWLDEEPADEEETPYAPHGEKDGEPHKVSDDYRAPTTRGHGYDAPSIEEAPTPRAPSLGQQWQRTAEGARRAQGRSRKRTTLGCVVALAVAVTLFGVVGDLLVSCVSLVTETVADGVDAVFFDNGVTFDDYVSDGGGDWRDTADELDLAAGEAVERRMGELLADPASGELHERVVAYLDEELLRWEGYTAAELGIDADAWATWALSDVTCEVSSIYAYDDGTGTAYLNIEARDLSSVINEADAALFDYLSEHDLALPDEQDMPELTDEQRAGAGAVWDEAMELAEPTGYSFVSVELVRTDGAWALDEADLEDALEDALGLY